MHQFRCLVKYSFGKIHNQSLLFCKFNGTPNNWANNGFALDIWPFVEFAVGLTFDWRMVITTRAGLSVCCNVYSLYLYFWPGNVAGWK